ncbi:MAG: hypothetical protein J6R32_10885 [Bacteroidales bacterium]|nr:hypothetical protein [Bacteroidales bacterium]
MEELKQYIKKLIHKYPDEIWALAYLDQYLFTCPLDLEDTDCRDYIKQDIKETLDNIVRNFHLIWGDE